MFGLTSNKQKIALWLILAVGLALRLWLIFTQHDRLLTEYDDKMYVQSAKRLLEAGVFTFGTDLDTPTVFIPPLFVLYLSGMFALFGTGETGLYAALCGIAVMGVLVAALTARLGARMKRPLAGVIAAAIVALYPPLIVSSSLFLTETPFMMWSLLCFIWLLKGIESGKRRHLIIAGLFLGLGTLTRPTFALFPAVVGLYLWYRRDYRLKKAFAAGLVLVLTLLAVLSPWIVRNYVEFHQFIPLTKASGNPFLTGTYINNDVWAKGHDPEFPDYPKGWKKVPGDQLATDERLMELGRRHLQEQFAADPWAMIEWYTSGKLKLFWFHPFDWHEILQPWAVPLTWLHRGLLLLSLIGIGAAVWRKDPYTWLLLLWLVYFTGLHLVYVTMPRYALPLLPYCFLFVRWKK